MTGYSAPPGGPADDYATVAYDTSTGQELWVSTYDGPGASDDVAYSVGVSSDGSRVFVTGSSAGLATSTDFATVAYDATTGAQLWVSRYNGPANLDEVALSLAVSAAGVFVTGYSPGVGTDADYATVAYDPVTGVELWIGRYNGPANSWDRAYSVAVSRDGTRVFVTGGSADMATPADYATVAYDGATGTQLWVSRYSAPGASYDDAWSVAVSPDGNLVYVTGAAGPAFGQSYGTVAYRATTGTQVWVARYQGVGSGGNPQYVAVSPDGARVFVTGYSQGAGSDYDYATVAYDAIAGTRIWAKRYNGPANGADYARWIAVSPDSSRVFVTGSAMAGATEVNYATIAYDTATGALLWGRTYNGTGNAWDTATVVVASPDGRQVFVTGGSEGVDETQDFATIAYQS